MTTSCAPEALAEMVRAINDQPDAAVFYSDEDKLDLSGRRCEPAFKPDWSPEHFLHRMYTCHLTVVRKDLIDLVQGFRRGFEGAQDYDLLLRIMAHTDRIVHVPRVLYHWRKLPQSTASAGAAKPWALDAGRLALEDHVRRQGMAAEVLAGAAPGLFRLKRAIAGRPLVSIVIPTAGRLRQVRGRDVDLLAQAVTSLRKKTTWTEYELIIVADAAGVPASTARALSGARHRLLAHAAGPAFNFSRKVNEGVAAAQGEHVLLFNDDLEVTDGRVAERDARVLAGPGDRRGRREAALPGRPPPARRHDPRRRRHRRACLPSASGSCRRATWAARSWTTEFFRRDGGLPDVAAGGVRRGGRLRRAFPMDFNDVDFCLQVRRAGYRIVWTPYAQLYHHESASFGPRSAGSGRYRRDAAALGLRVIEARSVLQSQPDPPSSRFPGRRLSRAREGPGAAAAGHGR